jgi:hypothetical protein
MWYIMDKDGLFLKISRPGVFGWVGDFPSATIWPTAPLAEDALAALPDSLVFCSGAQTVPSTKALALKGVYFG